MRLLIYNILTQAYFFGIKLASLWNPKAKQWVQGRVGVWDFLEIKIAKQRADNQRLFWIHCASLGEFEQGRPVLEALRKSDPSVKILLTFFSPSGYEIRKDYPGADYITYLPADSAANAKRFVDLVRPDIAIFVKYEFWYHYLAQLKRQKIPTLLISAIFRPSQPFFKPYGGLHRAMLSCFTKIMVQDEASKSLLDGIGFKQAVVAGDTRVDRVVEIANNPIDLPLVKKFCGDAPVLVCGSTWPPDEAMLYPIFTHPSFKDWKYILAPHDVQPTHLQAIASKLNVPFVRYSKLEHTPPNARLLLVDNIGYLSSLYQFGRIAYIGGGFGQGIHNILEPAAYGLPVLFGPKYGKFEEARWMVEKGGAFDVRSKDDLIASLANLLENDASSTVLNYIELNSGATQLVLREIDLLLTNWMVSIKKIK